MMSLGDRVLLLGKGCSFYVSASDLHIDHVNCVIFEDHILKSFWNMPPKTCILHLDEGRLSPLSDYPETTCYGYLKYGLSKAIPNCVCYLATKDF
jgi:hypothetical protein